MLFLGVICGEHNVHGSPGMVESCRDCKEFGFKCGGECENVMENGKYVCKPIKEGNGYSTPHCNDDLNNINEQRNLMINSSK